MLAEQQRRAADDSGRLTYNEVIVSSIEWQRAMPRLIEAFVFIDGDAASEARARAEHAGFAAQFGEAVAARTPILRYLVSDGRTGFELA